MKNAFASTWPLFIGVCIVGMTTGLQNTLLAIRAEMEGFSSTSIGLILAGYFIGFLLGSVRAPKMIQRVGHIRAFAALASLASISILIHAIWVNTPLWFVLRMISGFCFSAIFVIAESWINDKADNRNRGKLLSIYVSMLFGGMALGQLLLNIGDPRDYIQFTLVSILISAAVIPLLVTATPTPTAQQGSKITARQLLHIAPLGVVGCFILQFGYASVFGIGPVYFSRQGLNLLQLSSLMALFILGCLCFQFKLAKLSDRYDRRRIMLLCCVVSAILALLVAQLTPDTPYILYGSFFALGAVFLPIFSMTIAHTNDYLHKTQMVGASSILVRANGLGAVCGLFLSGVLLDKFGDGSFFYFIAALPTLLALLILLHLWRYAMPGKAQGCAAMVSPTQTAETMLEQALTQSDDTEPKAVK